MRLDIKVSNSKLCTLSFVAILVVAGAQTLVDLRTNGLVLMFITPSVTIWPDMATAMLEDVLKKSWLIAKIVAATD